MPLLPIVLVFVWWNAAITLFFIVKCKDGQHGPLESKYEYETLPIVHDDCNSFSAQHVYLLRLAYGSRNKKFFFPNATITIHFFNGIKEKVATAILKPKILIENHKRYLSGIYTQSKVHLLFVLFKRRVPMSDAKLVMLNHDMHGGTIMLYNLFALQLSSSTIFGTEIGKSIQCLEEGFDADTQTFRYTCFGRYLDYVGPCLNLSCLETLCLVFVGMSTILMYCSRFIICPSKLPLCGHFKSLSQALEASLYGGLLAVVLSLVLFLIYQCILKRINAKWNNIGNIWLVMKLLPYLIFTGCIVTDIITVWFLSWPSIASNSALSNRQQKLWLITVALAAAIYLLAVVLLVMVLYLNGYYDSQILPKIDFESDKIQPITSDSHQASKSKLARTKSSSFSTRNLVISSKLQEKSNLSQIQGESISKLIEATYGTLKENCRLEPSLKSKVN